MNESAISVDLLKTRHNALLDAAGFGNRINRPAHGIFIRIIDLHAMLHPFENRRTE